MNTIYHPSSSRGHANHGWLDSHHSFSFAGYFNPERMRFGMLRVLNDDIVAPGMGFGKHPHDNMEIISIPLKGALAHKDSTGRSKIIKTNDVQIMSAGTGIMHSEMNASDKEPVNFLQIWVFPKKRDITPRYEQKTFNPEERINKWQTVVSPDGNNGSVTINQDAWFSLVNLEEGQSIYYENHPGTNGVYVFVIEGSVTLGSNTIGRRDAMGIEGNSQIILKANKNAEVLLMEVPMNE